jgi:TusA-related sulfurtransferase
MQKSEPMPMPKEITLETKIADLLNDYDGMKTILININPKFKKLNNPVLRRTLGRIASVRQAAIVGAMEPMDLVDQLRKAVGQEPICEGCEIKSDECFIPPATPKPSWIDTAKVCDVLNANALLDDDKNPLAEVRKALHKMSDKEMLKLEADFQPEPLIEEFEKDGYDVWTVESQEGHFVTYIHKGA